MVGLHIPTPSPSTFNNVPMVMGRMGSRHILRVIVPVTIGTMLNFDGDGDGIGVLSDSTGTGIEGCVDCPAMLNTVPEE